MTKPIRSARAPWTDLVLVCRKCARKTGRTDFAKALKTAFKRHSRERVTRVVETACLDLCPKHRLTVATIDGLAARRLIVLPESIDAATAARILESAATAGSTASPSD